MTTLDPFTARIVLAVLIGLTVPAAICGYGIATAKRKGARHG